MFLWMCDTSPLTVHVSPTFPLGGIIDIQVLGSSSKISSFSHHRLLHDFQSIDDYSWFSADVQTVDISVSLPQLRQNNMACQFLKYVFRISHNRQMLLFNPLHTVHILTHRKYSFIINTYTKLWTTNVCFLLKKQNLKNIYIFGHSRPL